MVSQRYSLIFLSDCSQGCLDGKNDIPTPTRLLLLAIHCSGSNWWAALFMVKSASSSQSLTQASPSLVPRPLPSLIECARKLSNHNSTVCSWQLLVNWNAVVLVESSWTTAQSGESSTATPASLFFRCCCAPWRSCLRWGHTLASKRQFHL